ncbi:MAG: hypothetical protein IT260_01590 [Saprospiraceae bacterium]|nr:hypothetical protein [Saprospiraceae bacterium]
MKIYFTSILLLVGLTFSGAQTATERGYNRLIKTLGKLSIGTSQADFLQQKPDLVQPDGSMGFRNEIVEKIEQDGLQSVTYYFDNDGNQPLYELILEFSSPELRSAVIEKLFGPANHPEAPDHWILGVQDEVVSLGWMFASKFVLAANLPGTEWFGDSMFRLPPGFEPYKNLPLPTEWPKAEITRFFKDLQLQLDAAATGFVDLKGEAVDNYFLCKQPIGMAALSAVLEDDKKQLKINNAMTSDMTAEHAADWVASLTKILDEVEPDRYRLQRTSFKTIFGKAAVMWKVLDQQGRQTGAQLGVLAFGESLQSVFLVVLHESP